MLQEILKNTTDADVDKNEFEQALEKIKIVATACNESMKQKESREKLLEIQRGFGEGVKVRIYQAEFIVLYAFKLTD